jgi:uncharacterized OsmC-like protein
MSQDLPDEQVGVFIWENRSMSSSRVRESLERLHRVFLERPAAAKKSNPPATAMWQDGLRCEVTGPHGEMVVTDMPTGMGGDGIGPNPGWLLRASMASCTATAIAIRAARLGIALRSLKVAVQSESDARGLTGIDGVSTALSEMRMSIEIGADNVPGQQLRDLAEVAELQSPVNCTLRERPPLAIEISVV